MSGFEWQVSAHMIAEGMVEEGMAVARAVHDRYSAEMRNPYNEIECSDHYARSMASYGAFLSACGYQSHGPRGYLSFAPRLQQSNFKAAFTAAGGWGSYSQTISGASQIHTIELKYGEISLNKMKFEIAGDATAVSGEVTVDGEKVPAALAVHDKSVTITLGETSVLKKGTRLKVRLS
jgi:hypothetical protein